MAFDYRVVALPDVWPGKVTSVRRPSPFKTSWTKTEQLLAREVRHLSGRDVELAVDAPLGAFRQDGRLRADARPKPPVILSFRKGGDRLTFPSDRYTWWQENVYAIARTLEALRSVERWGVQTGKQYEGFKQLPMAGGSTATMGVETAAGILASTSHSAAAIIASSDVARSALRYQRYHAHPDVGGSPEKWEMVQAAGQRMGAHHGRTL